MKGICFIEPLFREVVKTAKTQTRRICSDNPHHQLICVNSNCEALFNNLQGGNVEAFKPRYKKDEIVFLKEPYYTTGDELYYKFLGRDRSRPVLTWKNKMFMPAGMARYFIEIKRVWLESIVDMDEEDAIAEGIWNAGDGWHWESLERRTAVRLYPTAIEAYADLFEEINKKKEIKFDPNTYVWAYEFSLYKGKEEDTH